jgi:hypothetical protein
MGFAGSSTELANVLGLTPETFEQRRGWVAIYQTWKRYGWELNLYPFYSSLCDLRRETFMVQRFRGESPPHESVSILSLLERRTNRSFCARKTDVCELRSSLARLETLRVETAEGAVTLGFWIVVAYECDGLMDDLARDLIVHDGRHLKVELELMLNHQVDLQNASLTALFVVDRQHTDSARRAFNSLVHAGRNAQGLILSLQDKGYGSFVTHGLGPAAFEALGYDVRRYWPAYSLTVGPIL